MVTKYGMSDTLGPVVYGSGEHEIFLGRDFSQGKGYSEDISAQIDREIRRLIDEGYARAVEILRAHEDKLHETAQLLLKQERINAKEFEALFEQPSDDSETEALVDDSKPAESSSPDDVIALPGEVQP